MAAAARAEYVPVAIVLGLGLLALYLSLFPVLRRVTRRLEEHVDEIRHQSLHDSLTGLPNRDLFRDRLQQVISLERREAGCAAVLLIDLDRFKEINDTLGHQTRRRSARASRRAARAVVRASDTVARLGGDEFAIVSPAGCWRSARRSPKRLRVPLARPVTSAASTSRSTRASGSRSIQTTAPTRETLLRQADVAMYQSKEAHVPML